MTPRFQHQVGGTLASGVLRTKPRAGTLIMRRMTCIEDLRRTAHRKVPRAFIDYAEAGSYAEQTLAANRADLERIKLRQRILFDVSKRSTETTILGEPAAMPL